MATTDDDALAEQYELFRDFADAATPVRAAANLRRLGVDDALVDALIARYEHHVGVIRELETPHYMHSGARITWYAGPRSTDRCWPALERQLLENIGSDGLTAVDQATTRIVSLLEHPETTEFSTKGLALGYVQSGKTTNYTGVVAKAVDRGYRLVIVLAGIHNELRRQTQVRLTRALVDPHQGLWHELTDPVRDFQPPIGAAAYFTTHSKQKVLCVVKKNAFVLRKLIEWLRLAELELATTPALIIDDEADQAAVATRTINPLIRDLLAALPRAAYIGYTATPFANLLIDPSNDDLYPKDFIVDLPKPADHFGTETIFGREPLDGEDPSDYDDGTLDMARIVPDNEVPLVRPTSSADVESFVPSTAGQLRRAVLYFWLATAARRARGQRNAHSTMLVHTSVRVAVHQSFRPPLEALRVKTRRGLDRHDASLVHELRGVWEDECLRVDPSGWGHRAASFDEVLHELPDVLAESRVVLDNSWSEDRLDYTRERQVAIAVGGNTLSRGLTLEGLVVSYFVRAASAYDTLLQMGRWFGYRGGYEDLPRIWMTEELRDWFRHIAGVEAEMRRDIARYMEDDLKPLTFAVRIREHPSLAITAAAKMRDAVTAHAAFGGLRVQTRYYRTDDPEWLEANQEAARRLVEALPGGPEEPSSSILLWREVPVEAVVNFLRNYRVHDRAPNNSSQLMASYAHKRYQKQRLTDWSVALVGSGTAQVGTFPYAPDVNVPKVIRSRLEGSSDAAADIKTLMSRRDAAVDLAVPRRTALNEGDISRLRREQAPTTALLALYAIDARSAPAASRRDSGIRRVALEAVTDAIGIGVVFPKPSEGDDDAVYVQADLSGVRPARDEYVEEEDVDAALESFQP